jgi:hypothetical protein
MNVPDNDKQNQEQFLELLKIADPELYMIKQTLTETRVNPVIVRQVLRSVGNLLIGSGYGKIEIFIQARVIKNIVGQEKVQIEESAEIDY